MADLDGDGHAEVIFTSWPQKSVGGTGQLHVLDYLGNPLHAVDLPAPFGGATWNGALGAPTLANVDGDGELEVVVGTVASGVVAYDLPGTGNARVLWGTGRGQPAANGRCAGPGGAVRCPRDSTRSRRAGCSTRACGRAAREARRSRPGRAGCCRSTAPAGFLPGPGPSRRT